MAIFDKLNTIAKNVGDKTGDAIEITKLNAKITTEKAAINDLYKKIGEACYAMHASGNSSESELEDLFAAVDGRNASIAAAQAQIEEIKSANVKPEAQPEAAGAQPETVCPACGAANKPGTRFCSQCGAKLEEEQPAARFCTSCGAQAAADEKFCSKCGTKLQ